MSAELSTTPEPAAPLVLTDVELAVLCGPRASAFSPFLAGVPAEHLDDVLGTAFRGLLARGLIDPPTAESAAAAATAGQDGISTPVRPEVAAVVGVRSTPEVAVAVGRTSATGQDYWYAYLRDDAVLVEEVATSGLHRFSWVTAAELTSLVVGACLAFDSADGSGEPVLLPRGPEDPTPPGPIADVSDGRALHTVVAVRGAGEEPPAELSMFTGPGGCWLAGPSHSGSQWYAVPGPADQLRTMIARLVDDARPTR